MKYTTMDIYRSESIKDMLLIINFLFILYVFSCQGRFEVNIPELPESIDVTSYMQQV